MTRDCKVECFGETLIMKLGAAITCSGKQGNFIVRSPSPSPRPCPPPPLCHFLITSLQLPQLAGGFCLLIVSITSTILPQT